MEQVTAGDVATWDAGLETLTDRLSGMLHRPEPKTTFGLVLRALLADVPKKNSLGLAEHAGLPTPRPFEHRLDGTVWDAGVMRDQVHDSVVAGLTPAGHAFIDQALYLPDVWTLNPARCQTAGSGLRDQPQLVQRMLARAITAGVSCGWFAADSGHGRDPGMRAFCRDHALAHVLAAPMDLPLLDARGRAGRCQDIRPEP